MQGTNFSIDLTGQVAFVTGASSGLGLRFAQTLASNGACVIAVGRRLERLNDVASEIREAGGSCVPMQVDVTDIERCSEVFDRAEGFFGPLSILINNAGIPDAQYATSMSPDLIDRVIATNLRAPFTFSCEFARRLIALKAPGRIVNMSSMAAHVYRGEGAALYSVTKAATERMTEVLSVEWARFNINVNAIAPGAFDSEMTDGMISRIGDFSGSFPRKRLGAPAQLDSTLLYLVSPSSDFVTGTIVKVDDGQHAR